MEGEEEGEEKEKGKKERGKQQKFERPYRASLCRCLMYQSQRISQRGLAFLRKRRATHVCGTWEDERIVLNPISILSTYVEKSLLSSICY